MLAPGFKDGLQKIPALCTPYKSTNIYSGFNCGLSVGFGVVYRVCFAMACFFLPFCIVMIRVHSSKDPRAKIQNGFWFFKILIYLALMIAAFFIPTTAEFFNTWLIFGMIGEFLFTIIQLVMLIDFAHGWNGSWIDSHEKDDNKSYYVGLVSFTILFYALSLAAIIVLYIIYAAYPVCGLNKFLISFNMIFCVIISIVSVLPKIQEHMPKSELLQSSLITLYVVYLTWSAMSNGADKRCRSLQIARNRSCSEDSEHNTLISGIR